MTSAQSPQPEPPITPTEERLAEIWSELLEQPVNSRDANFFDLGGHSLLAVQLVLQVRQVFGVELPIDDVYTFDMNLSRLAMKIDAYRLGHTDPQEYAALLAEIENMPEEEVEALLAKEDPTWNQK